jgi:hypothetical protein
MLDLRRRAFITLLGGAGAAGRARATHRRAHECVRLLKQLDQENWAMKTLPCGDG